LIKYIPIILICHTSIPNYDCKQENAEVTTVVGEHQNSPMSCLIEGQTRVASLAFAPKLGEPYYVKVRCVPKEVIE
jgi:hypothetical protein